MAAADEQRQARLGQRPVLELVDGDVGGEVVDAVERLAEPERQRLGRGDADQQRAGEAGAAGHGDRVDVVRAGCRRSRRPARSSAPSPRGGRGWRPRAPRRRSGRAPRRCWRPRRPAACGRGRCRRRSRRRTSRCRGPAGSLTWPIVRGGRQRGRDRGEDGRRDGRCGGAGGLAGGDVHHAVRAPPGRPGATDRAWISGRAAAGARTTAGGPAEVHRPARCSPALGPPDRTSCR